MVKVILFLILNYTLHSNEKSEVKTDSLFSDREYQIELPSNFSKGNKYGIIFALHGSNSDGKSFQKFLKLGDLTQDYIVIYPTAMYGNWEEGCKCNKPYRLGVDDIGFMAYLLDKFKVKYNVDQKKIFALGFSQGALFAHNIACKLSDRFKGIVTVASPMSVPLSKDCSKKNRIAVLMIHGTSDNVLKYEGSKQGSFSLLATEKVLKLWGSNNGFDADKDLIKEELSEKIHKFYYQSEHNMPVILYKLIGSGHYWPNEIKTRKIVLRFFNSVSRLL